MSGEAWRNRVTKPAECGSSGAAPDDQHPGTDLEANRCSIRPSACCSLRRAATCRLHGHGRRRRGCPAGGARPPRHSHGSGPAGAAGAPSTAIAAARAALGGGPLGYTETLGLASLRRRIARAYADWHGLDVDPARIVVTTGSSAGFMLAFLAAFEAGDRVAFALPGYPPYRHILDGARLRAGADRDRRGDSGWCASPAKR